MCSTRTRTCRWGLPWNEEVLSCSSFSERVLFSGHQARGLQLLSLELVQGTAHCPVPGQKTTSTQGFP